MQGVSRTLFEEVIFDAAGVKSLDWASYPVLRFQDVPDVQIHLINRPELPATGAAETPIVVVPAAIVCGSLSCGQGSHWKLELSSSTASSAEGQNLKIEMQAAETTR